MLGFLCLFLFLNTSYTIHYSWQDNFIYIYFIYNFIFLINKLAILEIVEMNEKYN